MEGLAPIALRPSDAKPNNAPICARRTNFLPQAIAKRCKQCIHFSGLLCSKIRGELLNEADLGRGAEELNIRHGLFKLIRNFMQTRMTVRLAQCAENADKV
jgi:hypothetical protein